MKILTIDRKDCQLDFERDHVVLARQSKRMTIPARQVERIIVMSAQQLHTRIFAQLAKHQIALVLVHRRPHVPPTVVVGTSHGDHARRLKQYQLVSDPKHKVALARQLMIGKLAAQKRCLHRARSRRPDQRKTLTNTMDTLTDALSRLRHDALNLSSLRGIEGASAAAYFNALATIFPKVLCFTGRCRRPPSDPVNAVLSLSYTLLYSEAVIALETVGLDPALGVLHEPEYGRLSLACDLQELYRARIDYWVWRLFAERKLELVHFNDKSDWPSQGCLLNKSGRQVFYPLWSEVVPPMARHMVATLRRMLREWQDDG